MRLADSKLAADPFPDGELVGTPGVDGDSVFAD